MQCPTDGTTLVMSDRNGIEIDYCPQCRGVWLDRGELDKIIERSLGPTPSAPPPPQRYDDRGGYGRDDRGYDKHSGYDKHGQPRRRRESWLGELFD
ncbi:TFIIB-type zinc ribbon-containing protein [Pseudolysinimonas sp.]